VGLIEKECDTAESMKKMCIKFVRLIRLLQLRAKYYRQPPDLGKVCGRLGINIEKALDLGSGPSPKNPFGAGKLFGIDIRSHDVNQNVKKCAPGIESIPFASASFDAVTAHDILEHIPRAALNQSEVVFPFVSAMNEIWRVLKIEGLFYSITPCFPMKEAFQDPTHCNIMTEDTLRLYFAEKAWARIYGYLGSFQLVEEGWTGSHYFCVLQKTSEEPINKLNSVQQ